jgi:hypothetical protein
MRKTIIIDIEKHFPSAAKIFANSHYFSPYIPMDQMKCLQPIPGANELKSRYGIETLTKWEELDSSYDYAVFVWPVHSFNDPGYTPNIEERRRYFKEIYTRLENKGIKKYIYLDGSDRAIVKRGLDWLDAEARRRFQKDFADLAEPQKCAIADDICGKTAVKKEFTSAQNFFGRFRYLAASGYYTTPQGWKDVGYVGNVPTVNFDGPTPEALKHLGLA